ncbi:MAG: adenylate/guanylate cyclase domain-containing protein, partial [Parvularculaceae bacterium]
ADVGGVVRTARGDLSPTEAHALLAAQIAAGATSYRPAWAGYLEAVLVMALGAAAIMWSQKLDFWRAFALSSLAAALVFAAAAVAFNASRLLIDPFPASLALFLGALTVAGGRSIGAVLTDDTVRGSFRGALPEPTMKKLREEGAARSLDAARREITVLACEVRLLDEDVERLAREPGVATDLIAAASEQIRKTLVECGGAVDQANGGKIFAYFNAPLEAADHARAACSAALRLVEGMDAINLKLEGATQTRGAQTHLAIGVASGVCVAGPMGHGRGNRYSAIGRAVELAAFLRRQAEYYGPAIICSEAVHREANPHFAFLELDRVAPRGGDKPFGVHALVGNPFIKSSKSFRQLDEAHRAMLAAYRDGAYLEARAHLNKARQHPGAGIALFDIYAARIDAALDGHDPDDPTDDDAPTGGRHETVTI